MEDFSLYPALTDPRIEQSSLYGRMFDRFAHPDPNAPYQMQDAQKKRAFRQGLLQFAAAVSRPNGGNFANSIASGLLAGSNSVNDSQDQYGNDAYRADIMKRTQAEMAANTAKQQAWQHLYGADGNIDPNAEAALKQADPQGYLDNAYKLHPEAKPVHWQMGQVGDGQGGTIDVMYDPENPQATLRTIDGKPLGGAPQGAPAPTTGGGPMVMGDALANAVQGVESGGNPYAVSPKGALGPMQTMPGTLRDPGFGVQPAHDNSPQEQARVGREYLAALTSKYGTQGGLAAYNMGPGAWQASLGKYGSPDAALAHAPAETQAYVPKVLSRVGQPVAMGGGIGTRPKTAPTSSVSQRQQELADMEAATGQAIPKDVRNNYLMTGKMPETQDQAVPGDPTKTGPDYLKTVSGDVARDAKALAEGRLQVPGGTALKTPYWQQRLTAAQQYDPSFEQGSYKVRVATRQAFTSGKQGAQINALNTTAGHLKTLADAAEKLHNGNLPLVNSIGNAFGKATGNPALTNFQAAIPAVASEMERIYRENGGSEEGIRAWKESLSPNSSPDQIHGVLKTWVGLIKSKLDAMNDQYTQGMGTMGTPLHMVNPHAQQAYDQLSQIVKAVGDDPASYGLPSNAKAQRVRYDAQGNRIP